MSQSPMSHGVARNPSPRLKHPRHAYGFLFEALHHTQRRLGRDGASESPEGDEGAHISGQELLDGVREFAREQFGPMAMTVFRAWGITSTNDIGHMVYELIDRGEMRKTDRDDIRDFYDYFEFDDAFSDELDDDLDLSHAFKKSTRRGS